MSKAKKKFELKDPSKTRVDKSLIAARGDEIIELVNAEISAEKLELADENVRMRLFHRIKEFVDGDNSGLDDVEKGILSKYVRSGIFKWETPQQFLAQIPDTDVRVTADDDYFKDLSRSIDADVGAGEMGRPLAALEKVVGYLLISEMPISNLTVTQRFVGAAIPAISAIWLGLLAMSFICGPDSLGVLTSFVRTTATLVFSFGSVLGWKFGLALFLIVAVVLPALFVSGFVVLRWNLWLSALLLPKHPLIFSRLSIGFSSDKKISHHK